MYMNMYTHPHTTSTKLDNSTTEFL
uniref:Uncharacterized protein n=1 Tax=Anguilla anguilla TaxID=7936 RepID=A0A0E9PH24_ANGAN